MREATLEHYSSVQQLLLSGWDSILGQGDFYVSTGWLRVAEIATPSPAVYLLAKYPIRQ